MTTKSLKELLHEIYELQKRLKATLSQYNELHEENDSLKEKLRNGGLQRCKKWLRKKRQIYQREMLQQKQQKRMMKWGQPKFDL